MDEGLGYFQSMSEEHRITPTGEHYSCLVDLGRADRLEEAERVILNMPLKAGCSVWGALLGACRIYNNVQIAERAAENVIYSEPQDAGVYVALSKRICGSWEVGGCTESEKSDGWEGCTKGARTKLD